MGMIVFESKDGLEVERYYKKSERVPNSITVGGVKFTKSANQVFRKAPGGHLPGAWPMNAGLSLGCLPKQRVAFMQDAERKGVPTRFNDYGEPVFTDRKHYNKYLRAYRLCNKDAGYGDVAPNRTLPNPDYPGGCR